MDKLKFYKDMYFSARLRFNKAEREWDGGIYSWYIIYQLGDVKRRWLRLYIMRSTIDKNKAIDLLNDLGIPLIGGQ